METTANIMMPGLDGAPRPARQRLEKAWPETLPRGLFVGELLLRELAHIAQDDFRGTALPAKLAELGEPVLVRTDPAGEEVEAFLRLSGGDSTARRQPRRPEHSPARAVAGQALLRLLNVTDGLLGQGTRTLVLITTNEPVKRLHPATRAGRCFADVEFTPFPVAEANAWLAAHGQDRRVETPAPLAEPYAHDENGRADQDPESTAPGFGFARVLA